MIQAFEVEDIKMEVQKPENPNLSTVKQWYYKMREFNYNYIRMLYKIEKYKLRIEYYESYKYSPRFFLWNQLMNLTFVISVFFSILVVFLELIVPF